MRSNLRDSCFLNLPLSSLLIGAQRGQVVAFSSNMLCLFRPDRHKVAEGYCPWQNGQDPHYQLRHQPELCTTLRAAPSTRVAFESGS